jgi:hypothetical protein
LQLSDLTDENRVEQNPRAKWTLASLTLVWSLLGLLGTIPAMFAVMMFDAPSSETNLATIAAAGSIFTFPLICLFTIVASWAAYSSGAYRRALRLMALPLISLVVGGAAFAWIELMQDGKFTG